MSEEHEMYVDERFRELEAGKSRLIDRLDLMADEFQRIKAVIIANEGAVDSEVIGICDRAVKVITQNVPVVVQRDNAEKELSALKARIAEMNALLDRMEHKQLPDKIPYPYTKWSCVDDCPACAWQQMKEKQI